MLPQDTMEPPEDPTATLEVPAGARVVIAKGEGGTLPPLTFSNDFVGRMRARLVFDVDAEWARRKLPAPHVDTIVRPNLVELDQVASPLEVRLETIAPIAVVGRRSRSTARCCA